MGVRQGLVLAVVVMAISAAWPAAAQESLDQGKTPAQLFASNCGICHKSTAGLSKGGGGPFGGLRDFLREHYTASKESAAIIAAYVEATDKGPPPTKHKPAAKRTAKGDAKSKKDEIKKDEKKEEKKTEKKPEAGEAKADEKKSDAKKPAEAKTETKSETKSEAKPTAKSDAPKASEAKPDDKKSGDKSDDKSKKSE